MTKKVVRNFGGWKSEFSFEKVKFGKFSAESEIFFENRGKSEIRGETRENASLPQISRGSMDAPGAGLTLRK